ncbi:hypothetical protein [Candidatus Methylacidithermus pantelleriae]|uniref:hypothetical protein n=1 Tax=Candidatus Methylacidithermus pantelleriae TaxID=2744239 RepID=UPI00157D790E|nr:hypothetical protein [Candidatus Methylacidithermus pantelleriae]
MNDWDRFPSSLGPVVGWVGRWLSESESSFLHVARNETVESRSFEPCEKVGRCSVTGRPGCWIGVPVSFPPKNGESQPAKRLRFGYFLFRSRGRNPTKDFLVVGSCADLLASARFTVV